MTEIARHYDTSADSYHEQYDRANLWSSADYPSNLFRLELVTRLLRDCGSTSVYEFGAGEATPLVHLHQALGIQVAGNDISPAMVHLGKQNLARHGLDEGALSLLDVEEAGVLEHELTRRGQFDAVMALGVIPHITDDEAFVSSLAAFCKPQGTLLLQFRNALFSMFTFNRLTKEFILDELLAGSDPEFTAAVARELDSRLAVDEPPVRRRDDGLGYDEILSRFHNPFELADVVRAQGFNDITFHWYNYHPTPPILAAQFNTLDYRKAQVALEAEGTWRGMFLCSAGVIQARRV